MKKLIITVVLGAVIIIGALYKTGHTVGTTSYDPFAVHFGDTLTGDVTATFESDGSTATTISANSIVLGTDTTGNYVATIADAGQSVITVTGSGSESAAVTLDITNSGITEADLKAVDSPTDEDIFTYESTTGDFEWHTIAQMLALTDTDSLSEGSTNLYQLTEEEVEDYIGGMLGGTETHITVTYQDATNNIDFVVSPSSVAGAIGEGELANSIVVSADIKDDTIDSADIKDDTIDSADYAAGSIDDEHVANDALQEPALNITNAGELGVDNYLLSYNHAGTNFTWVAAGAGDLLADGSVPMTANWDIGNYDITLKSLTGDGTIEGATITEGGVAVHNNDEMDSSSELAAIIDDETGTGLIVFGTTPTITQPTFINYSLLERDNDTASQGFFLELRRARDGDPTDDVSSGDYLGLISFEGYHTDGYDYGGEIRAIVDAAPGNGDMPGRLEFLTSSDGSATPTLRMAIDSAGNIKMGDGVWTNYTQVSATGAITQAGSATLTLQDGSDFIISANANAGPYLANSGDTGTGDYNFGGAAGFELPNAAAPTTDAAGEISLDTTITDHQPLWQYYDGGENMTLIGIDTAQLPAEDNEIVKYDAASDKFVLEADVGAATAWDDIGDPDAATTVDFTTYTQTIDIGKSDSGGGSGLVLDVTGLGAGTDDVIALEITTATDNDSDYVPIAIYDNSGVTNDLHFKVDYLGRVVFRYDGFIYGGIENYITLGDNSDEIDIFFGGTDVDFTWSDGALNLRNQENGIDAIVEIEGFGDGEKGIIRVLSDGDDKYIELYHDDTDAQIVASAGDIYLTAPGGDVNLNDDNLTTTGTATFQGGTLTGDINAGGADFELPQGQTPDTDGDIDLDFTDGSVVVQHGSAHAELSASTDVVVGKLIKSFAATIFEPDGVNDVIPLKMIDDLEFPHGVVIVECLLQVGTDSNYTLTLQNYDDFDTINAANGTIDAVSYTAGNDGEVTDTSITYGTIGAGQIIMMSIPSTDVDWIHIEVFYYEPIA